jgi:hypothetical protein
MPHVLVGRASLGTLKGSYSLVEISYSSLSLIFGEIESI